MKWNVNVEWKAGKRKGIEESRIALTLPYPALGIDRGLCLLLIALRHSITTPQSRVKIDAAHAAFCRLILTSSAVFLPIQHRLPSIIKVDQSERCHREKQGPYFWNGLIALVLLILTAVSLCLTAVVRSLADIFFRPYPR